MGRAPCCDKNKVKRGPWSPEEDASLKTYVHAHGTGGNWIALPTKAGLNRCGKSCRLRWMNYLRPDIKHGGFTDEEDCVICTLYLAIGSRWSVIASKLPGRTDNDVKNYWNTKLRKKIMAGKVGGFEARSTYDTRYGNHLLQPSSTQLAAVKQEPESNGFDHVPGLVASCDFGTNYEGISNQKMSVYSSSGCSSYESSRGFSGGGEQQEEGDPDDFWLRLLVEQSTFMEGSSKAVHQDMNEIVPAFDLPNYF